MKKPELIAEMDGQIFRVRRPRKPFASEREFVEWLRREAKAAVEQTAAEKVHGRHLA